MPVSIPSANALAIDMLQALGVPRKNVTRVTLDISATALPVLVVTRIVDADDMKAIVEISERFRVVPAPDEGGVR